MEKNEMIFGIRAVIEAVEAGKEIDKILVKKDLQGDLAKELFDLIKGRGFFVQRVPVERLNRITRKNHQGVIAFISAVSYQRLGDIIPSLFEEGKVPFIVLLDGITDVRNFGAIARTCEHRNGRQLGHNGRRTEVGGQSQLLPQRHLFSFADER